MDQAGIGAEAPHQVVDRLVALDHRGEPFAAAVPCDFAGELALVGVLEGDALLVEPLQVALHFRRIDRRIEIGQIPFREFRFRVQPALGDADFLEAADLRRAAEREAMNVSTIAFAVGVADR